MGKLFIVGIGPGDKSQMTYEARYALEKSDVLCGYTKYIDLVKDIFRDKEFFSTPMRQETERCRAALRMARDGKTVSMICSGDPGVYGMASLVLELSAEFDDVETEIIPGVTAALSGAAVLGAPLGHDFCVISLSDLLTPWEVIEKRLKAAAAGDFSIVLYNPSSRKRGDYLRRACDLLLASGKPSDTSCGWVRNIGRDGEESKTMDLAALRDETVDMFTTVFIGSQNTFISEGRLITPRGYDKK